MNAMAATTTITLAPSANPSVYLTSVSITATVTGQDGVSTDAPSGSVTFYDGGVELGSSSIAVTATDAGTATATFSSSAFTAGVHAITATYSGDLKYGPSASSTLSQDVQGEKRGSAL